MGPFQTPRGMAELRHEESVINSIIKREGRNAYSRMAICGCSRCCGFAFIVDHVPQPEKKETKNPPKKGIKEYLEWWKKSQES